MSVEEIVCNHYCIDQEILYSNSKQRSREETEALHVIWYILHRHYNMSYKKISKAYNKTQRNVEICIAKIRTGVNTQIYYKEIYNDIMDKIKGDSELSESPIDKMK